MRTDDILFSVVEMPSSFESTCLDISLELFPFGTVSTKGKEKLGEFLRWILVSFAKML